jgi:hypothetical protein
VTIWARMAAALAGLGTPAAANVYVTATGEALPALYLVYFLISSPPLQHADNAETARSYHVQVSIYSQTGLNSLPDVTGAMTAAGFTRGPEWELPYNQLTRHYGLALEFYWMEEE